jgi:hypothetical protein
MNNDECFSCYEDHDPNDPCLIKHIEMVKRANVLKEKIRIQTDLRIKRRNIRDDLILTPLELQTDDNKENENPVGLNLNPPDAPSDPSSSEDFNPVLLVGADQLDAALSLREPTFILISHPCDLQMNPDDVPMFTEALEEAGKRGSNLKIRLLHISETICVCTRRSCTAPNPLPSLKFMLAGSGLNLLYSKGRGISGFETIKTRQMDFDKLVEKFDSFIQKFIS